MRTCAAQSLVLGAMLVAIVCCDVVGQDGAAGRRGDVRAKAYKTRIEPRWYADGQKFWYRNELAQGRLEYVTVDCQKGSRQLAFDHARLAGALVAAGESATAERLQLEDLKFDETGTTLHFQFGERSFVCDLKSYEVAKAEARKGEAAQSFDRQEDRDGEPLPLRSRSGGSETEVTFVNRTAGEVELFWVDTNGQRRSYGKLAAGSSKAQHTFEGHVWEAAGVDGSTVGRFAAEGGGATVVIDGRWGRNRPTETRRGNRELRADRSEDGRWTAAIVNHNVVLRSTSNGEEVTLTTDGAEGKAYGMLRFAPDSQTLVAFASVSADRGRVHFVESSPKGGGRAVLHSQPYLLPGDPMTKHELRLFSLQTKTGVACEAEPIEFGTPRIRFADNGRLLRYEQVDRGHQRFRLVEVDCHTGKCRNLIDERSKTFLWTAHTDARGARTVNWLENSDEVLYASERDGWRHLYLVDLGEGAIRGQVTSGRFVVRGIDHIDEAKRQVWFRASGRNEGEDPYFVHHYRVNFDGTELTALTSGNGTHTVQFSPQREYLIDTYSRVDQAPISELRRSRDGELVCRLEEADTTEVVARGWEAPEVFMAKARDGQTDIWGIICRPKGFDPTKKYPVVESIYAGPHGSFVPKSYSSERRFTALTDAGFVVVQIDGMGTANRSKAFHDVCWQNLKDAGLPDRILWHQAVAAKYAWYDISRVGIYGTSAGGQNSTGAVLFHPEFYKVAVSACGCHDNRMDKASWNEQWMGYPVRPHYAESSNIDNAWRLQGKLFLIVGEMDTNVPPESTLRLADALIKAGKDFELLVVPGGGHGMGGAYGARRMQDFFVRHLMGSEPPNRNAPGK